MSRKADARMAVRSVSKGGYCHICDAECAYHVRTQEHVNIDDDCVLVPFLMDYFLCPECDEYFSAELGNTENFTISGYEASLRTIFKEEVIAIVTAAILKHGLNYTIIGPDGRIYLGNLNTNQMNMVETWEKKERAILEFGFQ